jgi:hypothetical protein
MNSRQVHLALKMNWIAEHVYLVLIITRSRDHVIHLSAALTRISLRVCSDRTFASLQPQTQRVVTMVAWPFGTSGPFQW